MGERERMIQKEDRTRREETWRETNRYEKSRYVGKCLLQFIEFPVPILGHM